MKNIAIYGAGGFGKETRFLIDCINRHEPRFQFKGYIDDDKSKTILRATANSFDHLAIAIASPEFRRKVYDHCGDTYRYPNLVDPNVVIDPSVTIKDGCIICAGVKLTVDINIGRFVIINLNATIGHDVSIASFSSIMPSANISGNVNLEEGAFVGSGATILQGLTIGKGSIVGAGAVVTRNVPHGHVARGVPARFYPIVKS